MTTREIPEAPPASESPADVTGENWHQRSVKEVYSHLGTRRDGLTGAEAAARRAQHGPNVLEDVPSRTHVTMLAAQFTDVMVLVLIGAAIVSGLIGELTDTLIIVAIVVLNAVLGFVQEFRAERAMTALKAMAAPSASVVRDGSAVVIAASELVPGDVVAIDAGRIVPADLRLVEVAGLRVNESALTGESVPVDKTIEPLAVGDIPVGDRRNIAHKGSYVTYGRALGLVVATGMRTELGSIAQLLVDARTVQTPLQRRLGDFGRRLVLIVLLICAIVFVTGLLRGEPVLSILLLSLSLAVAAIPEALPAVVSIALAIGARKMMANRALVRRLPAVETLGSVTFICSDKTGTLTANEMRVEQYFCDGERTGRLSETGAGRTLLHAMAISHDAVKDEGGKITGDPTEVALLVAAESGGLDYDAEVDGAPRVAELPFDSDRKCMTTLHRRSDGTFLSITKGAAEVIINASISEQRRSGLVGVNREELGQHADQMAAEGLRVLGVGVRQWAQMPANVVPESLERELEFVGLVGLIDPPRPEVSDAVATCKAAGIVPVMITGDHPLTARAVARRLGLIAESGEVITGPQLAALSLEEFERRVRAVRVYARVGPEQKVKIVTALQATGEIVAMTGDGVNDAPALKRADVGVAMGIQGTDVAREAAAIVLLDDNFATIVGAVREGRRIYDNLRRFVRYVLTTNSAEIWVIFLAPFLGLPVPLLPIQILWINLVTDGLPGLALAAEPAERDVMRRPPRPPGESIFAGGLGVHALLVGMFMAGLTLSAEAWYVHGGNDRWQTIVFTTLCFAQLGHVLAIRSERSSILGAGFAGNPALLATVALTIGLQLMLVYVPVLNALFKTAPLQPQELAVCVGAAVIILVVVEAEKWVRRPRQSGKS